MQPRSDLFEGEVSSRCSGRVGLIWEGPVTGERVADLIGVMWEGSSPVFPHHVNPSGVSACYKPAFLISASLSEPKRPPLFSKHGRLRCGSHHYYLPDFASSIYLILREARARFKLSAMRCVFFLNPSLFRALVLLLTREQTAAFTLFP